MIISGTPPSFSQTVDNPQLFTSIAIGATSNIQIPTSDTITQTKTVQVYMNALKAEQIDVTLFGNTITISKDRVTTNDKSIKASLGKSNTIRSGVILDSSRSYNEDRLLNIGSYHYKYVVLTDINVINGDSGSPVFGDNGQELLGIMVASIHDNSIYVKHEKFTQYFRGLTWDF